MLTKIRTEAASSSHKEQSKHRVKNKLKLIPYIYNNSNYFTRRLTDYSLQSNNIGRNLNRIYKYIRSIKEKNKRTMTNIPLITKCAFPINTKIPKLGIEKLKDDIKIRYANINTYKILQTILKRQYMFGLKQMKRDYELSNINRELDYVSDYKQGKMKLEFVGNNRNKGSVSSLQESKKPFINEISDFSLSILRSDYKRKELERIKSLRRDNLNKIYTNVLAKVKVPNRFTTLDNITTVNQLIPKRTYKESLKKRVLSELFEDRSSVWN